MKKIVYFPLIWIIVSCHNPKSASKLIKEIDTSTVTKEAGVKQNVVRVVASKANQPMPVLYGFENAKVYRLTDTIKADFNGDGVIDQAIFKKDGETSGIIITHGRTNEKFRIGFGKPFAHLTEFNWVDYWGLVNDKETTETTFSEDGDVSGSKNVILENPSLILEANELGGGLITFRNGKYEWIHQTC